MSIKASAGGLMQAVKDLMLQWEQTQAAWNDAKSQEFARKFLEEIPGSATRAVSVMEELDGLLRKVKSDCE